MPDYLEELLGGAQALLEELRQLEWGLAGAAPDKNGKEGVFGEIREKAGGSEGESRDVFRRPRTDGDREKAAGKSEKMAYKAEISGEVGPNRVEETVSYLNKQEFQPSEAAEGRGREGKGSALSLQLARLDRAASQLAGASLWRWGGTDAEASGALRRIGAPGLGGEEAERVWAGGRRGLAAFAGEPDWVERTDRAFRRDSRRYDGGFYLY